MHESLVVSRRQGAKRVRSWLFWILCCLGSGHAYADGTSLLCSSMGGGEVVDLGTLLPGQEINLTIMSSCRVLKAVSTVLTFKQVYTEGTGPVMSVFYTNNSRPVPQDNTGPSTACNPASCSGNMTVDATALYYATIKGVADITPGPHTFYIALISNVVGVADTTTVGVVNATYQIAKPSCIMGSLSALALPFGTLNSDNVASSQKIAQIDLFCSDALKPYLVMRPAQGVVGGSVGVANTTLSGLSMVTTWADDNTPFDFNGAHLTPLKKGMNYIRLAFWPRVTAGEFPAGKFSGQYTLSIYYP